MFRGEKKTEKTHRWDYKSRHKQAMVMQEKGTEQLSNTQASKEKSDHTTQVPK